MITCNTTIVSNKEESKPKCIFKKAIKILKISLKNLKYWEHKLKPEWSISVVFNILFLTLKKQYWTVQPQPAHLLIPSHLYM